MRYYTFLFLLFFVFVTEAQSHRLRLGVGGFYTRQASKEWFSTLTPSIILANQDVPLTLSSNPANGYHLNAFLGYAFFEGLGAELSVGYKKFDTELSRLNITESKFSLSYSYAQLAVHVYLFQFAPFTQVFDLDFRRSFFIEASFSYNAYKSDGNFKHNFVNPLSGNDTTALGTVMTKRTKFGYGIGFGYDFYISDKISISPYLKYTFLPRLELNNLEQLALTPPDQARFTSNPINNVHHLEAGLRLGITLIPFKKLCPIVDCYVQKEHKHAALGVTVVRGNKYNNKQYPLIGQNNRPSFFARFFALFARDAKYPAYKPKKRTKVKRKFPKEIK